MPPPMMASTITPTGLAHFSPGWPGIGAFASDFANASGLIPFCSATDISTQASKRGLHLPALWRVCEYLAGRAVEIVTDCDCERVTFPFGFKRGRWAAGWQNGADHPGTPCGGTASCVAS